MKKIISKKAFVAGVMTAVILTVLSCLFYGVYCDWVSQERNDDFRIPVSVETPDLAQLERIFGFQYVLYKDLCTTRLTQSGEQGIWSYQELFPDPGEMEPSVPDSVDSSEEQDWLGEYEARVEYVKSEILAYLKILEQKEFEEFNRMYDYWIQGRQSQKYPELMLTNSQAARPEETTESYAFLFQISYDEYGIATISNLMYGDSEELRRNLNTLLHTNSTELLLGADEGDYEYSEVAYLHEAQLQATSLKNPQDCVITIGMTMNKWRQYFGGSMSDPDWNYYFAKFDNYRVDLIYLAVLAAAGLLGAFYLNPRTQEKLSERVILRAPVELVVFAGYLLLFGVEKLYWRMTRCYLGYDIDVISTILYLLCLYGIGWYVGGCLGEIRLLGPGAYLSKRSLILRNWERLKRKGREILQSYREMDLSQNLQKKVFWILFLNALVILLFCCFWFAGGVGVVIYTVLLYYLIMKYLSGVQGKFQALERMTREMSEGNLDCELQESLGLFEPVKENLLKVRDGFHKAVQEEVRSQRMKTELITNVSHDLKTPLTAIITYIDLLKQEDLTREQQVKYLETLEMKSLRLKKLIEDLFEVSKANSGNAQLNLQSCDLVNLLKQVTLEMQDKLEEKHLVTRLLLPEEKVVLQMDSEKTYRIYENLLGNVAKYAMEGTRVYLGLIQDEEKVSVVLKNIAEAEISVSPQELTERFVRGDDSRGSVEGSGLGLAIVRSFTELQGGKLELEIDGDLFKVTTIWPKNLQ